MPVSFLVLAAAATAQAAAPHSDAAAAQAQAAGYAQAQQALTGAPQSADPAVTQAQGYVQAQQALAASPATSHGIALWRNVEDGMSVAQLHALFPQGANVDWRDDRTVLTNVGVIDGCSAKVNIMHPNGVVKEIVMRGDGSIAGRCSLKLVTALSGKYGEPMDKDKVHASWFGREGKNYIWAHDGVTLQMKRYTNGPFGGGGLLAASWELRYSAVATKIDL